MLVFWFPSDFSSSTKDSRWLLGKDVKETMKLQGCEAANIFSYSFPSSHSSNQLNLIDLLGKYRLLGTIRPMLPIYCTAHEFLSPATETSSVGCVCAPDVSQRKTVLDTPMFSSTLQQRKLNMSQL